MKFPDFIIFDNNIRMLLLVFVIIAVVALLRRWMSKHIASFLFMSIQKKWHSVQKSEFNGLIIRPLGRFLAVLISILAIGRLNFPNAFLFNFYGLSSEMILHAIGKCLILIYFIWVIQSFIDFIAMVLDIHAKATKDKGDDQLIVFFRDFVKAIIYIIGLLFILKIGFRVDVGALLTGLSIVGAALALAAKESIENLIASFIIFFDKPFFTGDLVKVNSVTGTVEHIGLRSTRIRTNEQTLVSVPNKQMVDGIVDNWSMRSFRRAEFKIEIANSGKTFNIEQFITTIKTFLENKKPVVNKYTAFITDFNKSSVTVTVEYFTIPFEMDDFLAVKQQVAICIKEALDTHQLKMANPTTDINIFNSDSGNTATVSSSII
jgi:MscS family membrane protein